ncbi:MAG: hypothetical protein D6775_08235 [Caldilineae bacterium]|nr:MAG: hypothetical protein D6775_08235 [Caldilineae bacterium]
MYEESVDLVIVGAGPAGLSTALHLLQQDPDWAGRMLILDKAVHPREKLCGGGITRPGMAILQGLGLELEPRHVTVNEVLLRYGSRTYRIHSPPLFHVVHRAEFDHWLLEQTEARGTRVRQGEGVVDVRVEEGRVHVRSERGSYRARALIAADGSNSTVKRALRWNERGRKARLLEVLTPEDPAARIEYRRGVACFDFDWMREGLQGYVWDFPSFVDGQARMNRGVYDSRIRSELPRASLTSILERALSQRHRDLARCRLRGHPIHWFDPRSRHARPHVLLVGDAAGVDPLFGEGIAFALAYGQVAAATLQAAFARDDLGFADYDAAVLRHPLLRQLAVRARGAAWVYRLTRYPGLADRLWRLAPLLFRLFVGIRPDYVPADEPRLVPVNAD